MVSFCHPGFEGEGRVLVVATLSKGYGLDYMWRQTDAPGVVCDTRWKLVCT